MPEVILNCPQCGRNLRVTEDLLSRLVKCRPCGLTFSGPRPGAAPRPAPELSVGREAPGPRVPEEEYAAAEDYYDGPSYRYARARSLVTPPAVCLLVANTLGLLCDLYQVI